MLLGWGFCDVLQCTSLHGIFLDDGWQPSVDLTCSVTNLL